MTEPEDVEEDLFADLSVVPHQTVSRCGRWTVLSTGGRMLISRFI